MMSNRATRRAEASQQRQNAKRNATRDLDPQKFVDLLAQLSVVMLQGQADQGYAATANMQHAAEQVLMKIGTLTQRRAQELESIREDMELTLKQKYQVELPTGIAALFADPEEILKSQGVPQYIRVMMGLQDLIMAKVYRNQGRIQIQEAV